MDSIYTQLPELEIGLRLIAASLLGGVIGLEREAKERPAGLRTHMLTSLAAAVFTVITFELFHKFSNSGSGASTDPIRIIQAVTAGVAFLAAGTIIQSGGAVKGLTTGASMWLAGAIGLACGAGYFVVAGMAAALATLILILLKWGEELIRDDAAESN